MMPTNQLIPRSATPATIDTRPHLFFLFAFQVYIILRKRGGTLAVGWSAHHASG